ncbi:TPA: recombinase, partial [Salmonella enterica]|nr:recombinase [Salmonella enterica]
MNLNDFDAPFAADDIEWRIQQSGKTRDGKVWAMVLAYVT